MKSITIILFAILLFTGSACTKVYVSVHQSSSSSGLTGTNCKLQRDLRNQDQKTDVWCWAASAHTVIEYAKNAPINQCDLVDAFLRTQLDEAWAHHLKTRPGDGVMTRPNCCMSTEPSYPSDTQENEKIANAICWRTGWPEYVFATEAFRMHFEGYKYDSGNPEPQGLTWDEIVAEICADRPMISAIHFSPELGGGAHTVVIGGYNELEDGSQWVHVYDPGFNTLEDDYYLWPYDVYLGDPGVFTHVRDYKNISLP